MIKELSFSSFGPKEVSLSYVNHLNEIEIVRTFPTNCTSFRCDGDESLIKASDNKI